MDSTSVGKISSFRNLIKQALIAFPEDSHLRIVDFLRQREANDEEIEHFKECWSRVVLGNQAFGRGNSTKVLNESLFADELLLELNKDRPVREVLNKSSEEIKIATEMLYEHQFRSDFNPQDVRLFNSVVSVFRNAKEDIEKTSKKIFEVPTNFLHMSMEEDAFDLEGMLMIQDAAEKMKLVWRRGELPDYHFHPINPDVLFRHSYKTGKLASRSDARKNDGRLPPFMSTDEVVGLNVKFDQSSGLRDAWGTYSFLPEFLSTRHFNIFPRALDIVDFEDPPAQMFVFENPQVTPFLDLLSPTLTQGLLEHPHVITLWCQQLAVAARALHVSTGMLYTPLRLEDLLVTEDGFLLLQRVGFTELDLVADEPTEHGNFDRIVPFIYNVLGSALSSSRVEKANIPKVVGFRVLGYALQNTDVAFAHPRRSQDFYRSQLRKQAEAVVSQNISHGGADDDGADFDDVNVEAELASATLHLEGRASNANNDAADALYEQYPTFTVLAGSHLRFELFCGEVRQVLVHDYLSVYGPFPDRPINYDVEYNVLHIVYKCENLASDGTHPGSEDVMSASSNAKDGAPIIRASTAAGANDLHTANVVIETSAPCDFFLEFSAALPFQNNFSRLDRRFACFRIAVIPDKPAKSICVQEVVNYLELFYHLGVKGTVFNTVLFRRARELLKDAEKSQDLVLQCVNDWITIKTLLKRDGIIS